MFKVNDKVKFFFDCSSSAYYGNVYKVTKKFVQILTNDGYIQKVKYKDVQFT